jgi:hypothetical protein
MKPPVLLNDPADLVNWMVFRAFANRHTARFVACGLTGCGKFGLRIRAKKGTRFCSTGCQIAFNVALKKDPEFGSPFETKPERRRPSILRISH